MEQFLWAVAFGSITFFCVFFAYYFNDPDRNRRSVILSKIMQVLGAVSGIGFIGCVANALGFSFEQWLDFSMLDNSKNKPSWYGLVYVGQLIFAAVISIPIWSYAEYLGTKYCKKATAP
jgi:hypothetical protein